MTVRQIENLVALLEYFAERQKPATLADIVHQFDWPRSSAFNILTTLIEAGYLYEPRARSGYYPTQRWLQLGQALAEGEPVPEALRNIIRNLAATTGETAWISAPSGLFAGCCHVNLPTFQVGMPIIDQGAFAADFHASKASSRW